MNHLQTLCQAYERSEARALYRWVMEERFGLSQADLLLGKDTTLSAKDDAELAEIVQRLMRHEPVQYVLGSTTFCGHRLGVEPSVLIPRPETQEMVEHIVRQMPAGTRSLDIGTGSGCIAITLALSGHKVTAFDISPDALRIARHNAQQLNAVVDFRQVDILTASVADEDAYDCIVSNPPYICQGEAKEMDSNVLDYEPHLALFVPDADPLRFYRAIAHYAQQALCTGGWLWLECNRAYAGDVAGLLRQCGMQQVEVLRDDFGNDRFVKGCKQQ